MDASRYRIASPHCAAATRRRLVCSIMDASRYRIASPHRANATCCRTMLLHRAAAPRRRIASPQRAIYHMAHSIMDASPRRIALPRRVAAPRHRVALLLGFLSPLRVILSQYHCHIISYTSRYTTYKQFSFSFNLVTHSKYSSLFDHF